MEEVSDFYVLHFTCHAGFDFRYNMFQMELQGNIARWLKKEGDKVSPGDVICEVETVCNLSISNVGFFYVLSKILIFLSSIFKG